MSKREITYPKYFTGGTMHKLIGMKLIYKGSIQGTLSGAILSVKSDGGGVRGRASILMKIAIDWTTGTTDHDLHFGQMRYVDKNTIKGDSYGEITIYPNGYPIFDCSLCKSQCKAPIPCDLYESLLKR